MISGAAGHRRRANARQDVKVMSMGERLGADQNRRSAVGQRGRGAGCHRTAERGLELRQPRKRGQRSWAPVGVDDAVWDLHGNQLGRQPSLCNRGCCFLLGGQGKRLLIYS